MLNEVSVSRPSPRLLFLPFIAHHAEWQHAVSRLLAHSRTESDRSIRQYAAFGRIHLRFRHKSPKNLPVPYGVGLKWCNDLIYRVVTFLYRIIGNEKATVYFQLLALKYRISNNLLQDTKNFWNWQIKQCIENILRFTSLWFKFKSKKKGPHVKYRFLRIYASSRTFNIYATLILSNTS